MKVLRSLSRGLALTAVLATPTPALAFAQSAATKQGGTGDAPRWTIATRSADGTTTVREYDGPKIPDEGPVVVTRGIAFGVGQAQGNDDAAKLSAAIEVLRSRGYDAEARRLSSVVEEIERADRTKKLEKRAARLLEADIDDRAIRVAMLDVISRSAKAAGTAEAAEAIGWLADIGRSQMSEDTPAPREMPRSLQRLRGSEPLMGEISRIILRCATLQRTLGNENTGAMAEKLAHYYTERTQAEARRAEAADEPEVEPQEETRTEPTPREADLTYIEGRVPVLELAHDAYELEGGPLKGEERATAERWMDWMVASGRARVVPGAETPDMPPSPVSMDAIIGFIEVASKIYAENDQVESSKRCRDLAVYYAKRQAGEAVDNSRGQVRARQARPEQDANELRTRRRALEQEIETLQRQIQELRDKLDRSRRGGGRRR